ncbi:hypothetical protein [Paraburkholderia sp. BL18I3N2]|uniref:hypothetical protein n=1 Tax=Paraburkholderia sp. BL18I3N2 TaxID=1938799 RepID=UPI0011B26E61|nr:hypothetical protein [Paraburkholderia sp. BL18I3N2]
MSNAIGLTLAEGSVGSGFDETRYDVGIVQAWIHVTALVERPIGTVGRLLLPRRHFSPHEFIDYALDYLSDEFASGTGICEKDVDGSTRQQLVAAFYDSAVLASVVVSLAQKRLAQSRSAGRPEVMPLIISGRGVDQLLALRP